MCFKNITQPFFFVKRKTSIRAIVSYHAALYKHCICVYMVHTQDRLFLSARLPDAQRNRDSVSEETQWVGMAAPGRIYY